MTAPDIDLTTAARRQELLGYLNTLHWRTETLAKALNLPHTRVRRWVTPRHSPPNRVLDWLRLLASYHEEHRYPDDWWRTEPLPEITDEEEEGDASEG